MEQGRDKDRTPEEVAEELIRQTMGQDRTHNYELEQFAQATAHMIGIFWQTLGQYMPEMEVSEYRHDLTRLYALRVIYGENVKAGIDA